jgi:MFS transporter, DHA2 family, multidrug resistance protein
MSSHAATADQLAAASARQGINKWGIAAAVALGALLEVVDTSIVNVALTDMQSSLGATLEQIGWVVSSYAVANVVILPMTAWLGDRFGKRRYFIFSLIAFTLSSILCGMATTLPMLIAARVLQGLGGGGLLAKAQSFLFETFPKEEQAMAQGFFGAIVIAGPAIGPTLGGWIVTNVSWRWIFFINIPVGIVGVMMCASFLPKDELKAKVQAGIDWLSIALLVVGLGALQTVLEEGQSDDWFESSFIVVFSVLAVVGIVSFVWRQLNTKNPVVDLRVLRNRSLWAGSLLSVVVGMALYGALFAVPIFASTVMRLTSQQVGMMLLPGALVSAVMMPLTAKLLGKYDARMLLACGALILAGAVLQLGHMTPMSGEHDFFWPLVLRAIGTVLMFLPLNMATLGPIPKKDVAAASGFFNLTRQLGGSIGVALLTTLLARRQAFHRAVLVEKVGAIASDAVARVQMLAAGLMARGMPAGEAHTRALALLDGTVSAQAAVLSFADTFVAVALLIVVTLPLVLLLGKVDRGSKVEMGH